MKQGFGEYGFLCSESFTLRIVMVGEEGRPNNQGVGKYLKVVNSGGGDYK